jgi:hypothetical protein
MGSLQDQIMSINKCARINTIQNNMPFTSQNSTFRIQLLCSKIPFHLLDNSSKPFIFEKKRKKLG